MFTFILGVTSNWTKIPSPLFKKVVIVLIDALRDDFVFGSKGKQFMPYTTELVEKGTCHSFIAEAKPPTVTMPRIKVSSPILVVTPKSHCVLPSQGFKLT